MRIFYCTTFLHFGAGRVLVDLAKLLVSIGHEAIIAATKQIEQFESQQNLIDDAKNSGIPVYLCEDLFTRDFEKVSESAHLLAQIMKDKKFDLIHSYAAMPGFASMLASMDAYSAYLPHICSVNGWGLEKKSWMKLQDALFLNNVDIIHAGSFDVERFLISEGVDSGRIKTIYNGCDFHSIDKGATSVQKFVGNSSLRIGTIAELSERKNIKQLLNAVAILPDAIKANIEVIIVGDGVEKESLLNLAHELNIQKKVRFTGYVKNYYSLLKDMDLFILPSRTEGLPVVLVEAMYLRIPVIATSVQGNKEIAGHNRGVLVPLDDDFAMMRAIEQFYLNPSQYTDRVHSAYEWVRDNFSQEHCFSQFIKLYEQILHKK